jgi:glycosyltransferase involved in cell wall biosynthesis
MNNKLSVNQNNDLLILNKSEKTMNEQHIIDNVSSLQTGILFITTYPPRECGIATYSRDLINALTDKFHRSFSIKICALETDIEQFGYPEEVKYILNTSDRKQFSEVAIAINRDDSINIVFIQHEFGFFRTNEAYFQQFLSLITKPVIITFHTVLPHPDPTFKAKVVRLATACKKVIVMTHTSKGVLTEDYDIPEGKIAVIAHGTHLVSNSNKNILKRKYGLKGHKILSTFGLLSSGKSIETTLDSLPGLIKIYPEIIFLVIGKTHPGVIKAEGEKYRHMLEAKVVTLKLGKHVKFVNQYLELPELLECLQLTDVYLFTSKDPNQAVSGTFSYAMSCACPIISTPIPQAREMLDENTGIIIDFQNSEQLTQGVIRYLDNEKWRKDISTNTLHKIAPTAWQNSAIAHALLFENVGGDHLTIHYAAPSVSLKHIKQLTTPFGMIQFSKINHPDITSGYTLDDNARALIAVCMHYELTQDKTDLDYMQVYLKFIEHCAQPDGRFLNYVNNQNEFTPQNTDTNLEDANGRAIWALGYVLSCNDFMPENMVRLAEELMQKSLRSISEMHSSRAMAFTIKGLYYSIKRTQSPEQLQLVKTLADRLVAMYMHETEESWHWFESYLTYANSILSEAILCAWLLTKDTAYQKVAVKSFDFLLSRTFDVHGIKVISNKGWLHKGEEPEHYGEQPIDVSYTILALYAFYTAFQTEKYAKKMIIAFNWFLGNNHLHQIIYNPCTGGCYDGLEKNQVNLNQGAESTVSYLMARLTMAKCDSENRARTQPMLMPQENKSSIRNTNQIKIANRTGKLV